MTWTSLKNARVVAALLGMFLLTIVLAFTLISLGLSDDAAFVTAGLMFTGMWILFGTVRWLIGRRNREGP